MDEYRIKMPEVLLRAFEREPRILIKWSPIGLWPIGPGPLLESGLLERLAQDREFMERFEIVIMPK
ncbi:MAG: hypothetical protein PVG11_01845 [Anaerolineae bacterium]